MARRNILDHDSLASRLKDRNPPLYSNKIIKSKKERRSQLETNTTGRKPDWKGHVE